MGRNRTKFDYQLDKGDIKFLRSDEIKAILRAADGLIAQGGRSMLAKILKGSKDKKLLSHKLEQNPFYGFYNGLTIEEITHRIDWMILNKYFFIEYSGQIPVLVYSEKGWEIERETYVEELYQKLFIIKEGNDYSFVEELKDRNRGMILMLIERIRRSGHPKFIPLLKAWKAIDYKKVKAELQKVIQFIEEVNDVD